MLNAFFKARPRLRAALFGLAVCAPCFAVGVRLEEDGELTVAAPFGLDDVFDLTIRPTPDRPVAKDWDRIIELKTAGAYAALAG